MRSVDPRPYRGSFTHRAGWLTALVAGAWLHAAPARAGTVAEAGVARAAPVAALLRDDRAIALRDNTQLPSVGMGTTANSLQLTLTLPLPVFDHGQHESAKARAHALEQRHVAEGIVTGARSDFAGLVSRKGFLESALKTLDAVAVPRSTSILDAMVKSLDQGQVNMTDLLLARRTHLSLVVNQMDMHFEYFGVRNDLRHTLGLDTAGMSAPPALVGSR